MQTSSQHTDNITRGIENALNGNTFTIEGVFPILVWDPKNPRLMVGRHPNAEARQRTLPQFDIGIVRWHGKDAFMKAAENAFAAHMQVSGGAQPTFTLLGTYGHTGHATKKLLVYVGVILSPETNVELISESSFENVEWVNPRGATIESIIRKGVRDVEKATEHLKAIEALLKYAQHTSSANIAA